MRKSVVVLVAVVATMVAALAPAAGVAAADLAPTTVTLSGPTPSATQHRLLHLRATVGAPSAVTGSVVFREGAVVLAQVPVFEGDATLRFASPVPGPRTITAEYLGSSTLAPSSATTTFTVEPATITDPMTGTLTSGSAAFVVGAGNRFSIEPGVDRYDPVTGEVDRHNRASFTTLADEVAVAGIGTVGVTVHPTWSKDLFIGADGTVAGTSRLTLSVITVDALGLPVDPVCRLAATSPITGSLDEAGLHLSTSGTFAPLGPNGCVTRTGLVNTVLAGAFALSVTVPGPFPLPPPPGTATSVQLVVDAPDPAAAELAHVTATVSAGGFAVSGAVRFFVSGVAVAGDTWVEGGVAARQLDLGVVAPAEIRAEYLGRAGLLPSSASVVVDIEPPPAGAPVGGTLAIGTLGPDVLEEGAVLAGGSYDPASGEIADGTFWFPAGEVHAPFAATLIQYRLHQLSPAAGQVDEDGSVSFGPATFAAEVRSYGTTAGNVLDDCTIGPFTATLTGTADVHGLHLAAASVPVPPPAPTACGGLGSVIAPELAGGAALELEVEGDYRRDGAPTPMALDSWFPTVARGNHTFLVARLDGSAAPAPTGEVVFRDGAQILGTAPVGPTGVASIVVPMEVAGSRTVTADYAGDDHYGAGSATTTVEVVAPPAGRAVTGSFTVAGSTLAVEAGSVLVPGQAPGTSAMSLEPTSFVVDLPTWGPVTVEARLVAAGDLTTPTVDGSSITGLGGLFALHIRRVTTSTGTTIPIGCVDIVGVVLAGTVGPPATQVETTDGAIEHLDLSACRGVGRAVTEHLASGPVTASLTIAD